MIHKTGMGLLQLQTILINGNLEEIMSLGKKNGGLMKRLMMLLFGINL
ncbi:MAG: hypothetical protein ISQ41_06885 [Flavobacteriaceae bacterium]|nr:hypothetical protein [Flavobacteriaceae bacterium]